MAIDTLRGKTASLRRSFPRPNLSALTRRQKAPMPSYGIGDADAHVFNCPVCARPLPDGTFKCPGCSTHLVFGVTLKRAGGLLSFGLVVGILFGGLAMSVAIGLGLPSTSAAGNGTTGITNPGTGPAPTPDPVTGIVPDVAVPKAALSAMRQIALLDQRIAEDGAALKSAVKANRTADIARRFERSAPTPRSGRSTSLRSRPGRPQPRSRPRARRSTTRSARPRRPASTSRSPTRRPTRPRARPC